MTEIIDGYCKETMTENEAQKWLERFEWDDSEETSEALATICEALQEYPKFKAIGTVDEFKALKEKSEPKKILKKCENAYKCPICNHWVGFRYDHCDWCGQKLDWSE